MNWINLFAIIGMITVLCSIGCIIGYIIIFISDKIKKRNYERRRQKMLQERFDNGPNAKCFCKDCRFHGGAFPEKCNLPGVSRFTPDWGFCYEAEPKKEEK